MPGNRVTEMMESDPLKFYNVIDAEANKCPGASFKKPSFLDEVSLGRMNWEQTPAELRPVRESNYLLISQMAQSRGSTRIFHPQVCCFIWPKVGTRFWYK